MNPKVVMIDLETLSLAADAVVTQVGLIADDLSKEGGDTPRITLWLADSQADRRIDLSTVRWWMGQADTVKGKVFTPDPQFTLTIDQLFDLLKITVQPDVTVWAKPASFDFPVLTSLFGNKKPWSHRQERCLQTLAAVVDPDGALKPADNVMAHDAGADAEWQLQYLRALYGKVTAKQVEEVAA